MPRVHLPRDFGLATLTCGSTESLGDALRAELAIRQWTDRELARRVGKSHSTVGNYLRGERPFPDDLLADVLAVLLEAGPFHVPGLAQVSVIPTRGSTWPAALAGSTSVDTVTVVIDVPLGDQMEISSWLDSHWRRATSQKDRRRSRRRWHQYRFGDGGIVSHHRVGMNPAGWLLVEFRAFDDDERNGFDTIKNFLPRTDYTLVDRMRVVRLDIAVDYPVHPTWLLLRRPGVRGHENIVNRRGECSVALGSRSSRWYLRCYDRAAKHKLPGPLTRIEVELKPETPWTAADIQAMSDNPFERLYLGELTAPDLTDEELLQLELARVWGVKARQKVPGASCAALERAMSKAAAAPRLCPNRDVSRVWAPLRELLWMLFVVG
jgi:transcriptional regulator with XRE-family HTH domain